MSNYKSQIGDGKFPNKYWVFQYDMKFKRDKENSIVPIEENVETKNSLLGEFKTFKEALSCVDNKAYLPNVVIEDRLTGVIFEQMCIVCQECGKEEWETIRDEEFSKKQIESKGQEFV